MNFAEVKQKETESFQEYDEPEDDSEEALEDDFEYSLTSYGVDFDISGLVRRFNNGSIYIPDFQRNYVWDKKPGYY